MYCRFCGKQVKDGAKFCGACGKPTLDKTQRAPQPAQPVRNTQPVQPTQPQQVQARPVQPAQVQATQAHPVQSSQPVRTPGSGVGPRSGNGSDPTAVPPKVGAGSSPGATATRAATTQAEAVRHTAASAQSQQTPKRTARPATSRGAAATDSTADASASGGKAKSGSMGETLRGLMGSNPKLEGVDAKNAHIAPDDLRVFLIGAAIVLAVFAVCAAAAVTYRLGIWGNAVALDIDAMAGLVAYQLS